MIERKMRDLVQSKLAEENMEGNTELEEEVTRRMKKRERVWEAKILTATQARKDSEFQAKTVTVPALIEAIKSQ